MRLLHGWRNTIAASRNLLLSARYVYPFWIYNYGIKFTPLFRTVYFSLSFFFFCGGAEKRLQKAVASSPDLRNKKELIERFVDQFTPGGDVTDEWQDYVKEQRKEQLDTIIREERLRPEATYAFMNQSFRDGSVQEGGTGIAKILPPPNVYLR